jgi:transcriptional regulatory protein LevR
MNNKNNFISTREAMEITGYSRMHILRLIKSRVIKGKKIGNAYIVERNSIGGIYKEMTSSDKSQIEKGVDRVISEYGEALKKLGKE